MPKIWNNPFDNKHAAEIAELRAELETLRNELVLAKANRVIDREDVYSQYFQLSSDLSLKDSISTESSIARDVWDTGGEGGMEHKKSHSHWSGEGGFGQKFEAWGERCKNVVMRHPHFNKNKSDYKIAEYGSGGGAVLNSVSSFAEVLHGFDISKSNLEECQRVIGDKFQGHLVNDDLSNLNPLEVSVDIFLSFNVFQHFPSRGYANKVLAFIGQSLKSGGLAIIDIRYDNGDPKFSGQSLDSYNTKVGHTYPNAIRIDLFVEMLEQAGLSLNHVGIFNRKVNNATFWVTKSA